MPLLGLDRQRTRIAKAQPITCLRTHRKSPDWQRVPALCYAGPVQGVLHCGRPLIRAGEHSQHCPALLLTSQCK